MLFKFCNYVNQCNSVNPVKKNIDYYPVIAYTQHGKQCHSV